jgi:hypothetical protein
MTVSAMRRAGLRWRHPYALIVPMALFCFGEESSWALDALDIDPPRVLGLKIDAVHDLFTLAFALYVQHGSWRSRLTVALGAAIVVAVAAATRHLVLYPLAPRCPRIVGVASRRRRGRADRAVARARRRSAPVALLKGLRGDDRAQRRPRPLPRLPADQQGGRPIPQTAICWPRPARERMTPCSLSPRGERAG